MTKKYSHYEKFKVTGEPGLSEKIAKSAKLHDKMQGTGNAKQGAEEQAASTVAPAAWI